MAQDIISERQRNEFLQPYKPKPKTKPQRHAGYGNYLSLDFYFDHAVTASSAHEIMVYQSEISNPGEQSGSACTFPLLVNDSTAGLPIDTLNGYTAARMARPVAGTEAVQLFPNPASREVTLQTQLTESDVVDVYVLDITGKTVGSLASSKRLEKGLSRMVFDLSKYPDGQYIMRVQSTTLNKAIHFAIQHD